MPRTRAVTAGVLLSHRLARPQPNPCAVHSTLSPGAKPSHLRHAPHRQTAPHKAPPGTPWQWPCHLQCGGGKQHQDSSSTAAELATLPMLLAKHSGCCHSCCCWGHHCSQSCLLGLNAAAALTKRVSPLLLYGWACCVHCIAAATPPLLLLWWRLVLLSPGVSSTVRVTYPVPGCVRCRSAPAACFPPLGRCPAASEPAQHTRERQQQQPMRQATSAATCSGFRLHSARVGCRRFHALAGSCYSPGRLCL